MEAIQEDGDEYSLSGISFPSLDRMHFQEEHGIIPPSDVAASGNEIAGIDFSRGISGNLLDMDDSSQSTSYGHDDEQDDGYPTDEHTAPSFAQSKEKETKRQSILQLARNRIANKMTNDVPREVKSPEPDVDDSSFLGNADAIDVEINQTDDSSFLVDAGMDDVPDDDFATIGNRSGTVDTCYDIHASTLSIGDQLLLESNVAAQQMRNTPYSRNTDTDSQSASTYSYRRAYVDNLTLGSTCSALTDEYFFDARRTGMSEAIKTKDGTIEESSYEDIQRVPSGPIDSDTGDMLAQPSDKSHEESLARPPPPRLSNPTVEYQNPEHLNAIVSFGGGEGYVDEEAARKYDELERGGSGCCGWFTSSSRFIKLVVLLSVLLCLISLTSVALAFLLPREERVRAETAAKSSAADNATVPTYQEGAIESVEDYSMENNSTSSVPTTSTSPAPSPGTNSATTPPVQSVTVTGSLFNTPAPQTTTSCQAGAKCFKEGLRCTDGSTETCCGETFDSFVCDCSYVNGQLEFRCFFTDACFAPSCETSKPSVPVNVPTMSPSKSPEAAIYTTASLSRSPTKQPSKEPTKLPTKMPTKLPTQIPTKKPSNQPTSKPSQVPTNKPTSQPTPNPITERPTKQPTPKPVTSRPTLRPTVRPSPIAQAPNQNNLVQTVKLRALWDAFFDASSPALNYGKSNHLRVDGSPRVWSVITFNLPSLLNPAAQSTTRGDRGSKNEPRKMREVQVLEAKLRVYTLDEGSGGIFFALPNVDKWEETKLTWNTMYQIDRSGEFQVGSLNWVNSYHWYEIDVTAAFKDNLAASSFLIKSDSRNGIEFASRERNSGSHSPELVIKFRSGVGTEMQPTTPVPSPWPTYAPTYSEVTNRPTRRPTRSPSKRPSRNPTQKPTTPEPSRRPTTRAPHKRPLRPHRSLAPTAYAPSDYTTVKSQINPTSFSPVVPRGCVAANDMHLALEQAHLSGLSDFNTYIVFPSQDGYVRGGKYSDKNSGSSGSLLLDSASKVLIEYDLGLLFVTSSIYNILSVALRLFVESVDSDDDILLTMFTLPDSAQWNVEQVSLGHFDNPSEDGHTFEVKPSDVGTWIDVDITDYISGSQVNRLVIAMDNVFSSSEGSSRCVFASSETCHSSKLVVVTE